MRAKRMVMRPARVLLGTFLLVMAAGCAELREASQAQPWVEVSPSTAAAGARVAVRGNCVKNDEAATVRSPAFGTVTVTPEHNFLEGETTIPPTTRAGKYEVKLICPDGKEARTELTVMGPTTTPTSTRTRGENQPTEGPDTGGGYLGNGSGGAQ